MDYIITRADLEKDKASIIGFWKKNFPDWPEEKFDWFYKNNPAGEAICWLVSQKGNQEIIGTIALFPRIFNKNNREIRVVSAGDLAFNNDNQNFWPAFMLEKKVISYIKNSDYDFIYGIPNILAKPLMLKVGYKKIGSITWYIKKIKTHHYLKKKIKFGILAYVLSKILDLVLYLSSKEFYRLYSLKKYNYEISDLCDTRFDKLWDESRDNYEFIGNRSSEFINWRFNSCPTTDYKVYTLTSLSKDIIFGYIVYKNNNNNEITITDVFVKDLGKHFDLLMESFLKYIRKTGAESIVISFFGNTAFGKKLKGFNFFLRNIGYDLLVYGKDSIIDSSHLNDLEAWYITEADNDV